jgi:hypothetical protein
MSAAEEYGVNSFDAKGVRAAEAKVEDEQNGPADYRKP